MIEPQRTPLAWVESPLQLLCAAEYAARLGRPIAVALRLTGAQMPVTAQELLDRGALFSSVTPYFGIPWALLRAQPDWVIGDGFSGQFQLAATVLRSHTITLVDDGDMTRHLAAALLGRTELVRPGRPRSGLAAVTSGVTRERMLRLAASERLTMFSAFTHDEAIAALSTRDVTVEANGFDWLRAHARPIDLPHPRVVLGSAGVVDGILDASEYSRWVGALAAESPVSYLPHRREPRQAIAQLAQLPGVTVVHADLPAELVLAGTRRPLKILSMGSSATTTLRHVLDGTGSTIRVRAAGTRSTSRQRATR